MSGGKYLEDIWKTHPVSTCASSSDTDVRVQAEQSVWVSYMLTSLNFGGFMYISNQAMWAAAMMATEDGLFFPVCGGGITSAEDTAGN